MLSDTSCIPTDSAVRPLEFLVYSTIQEIQVVAPPNRQVYSKLHTSSLRYLREYSKAVREPPAARASNLKDSESSESARECPPSKLRVSMKEDVDTPRSY